MTRESTDHRTAIAKRNAESILDATESLLERGAAASTTAVAAGAGVSRVTVYSHFPTHEALLEAVAERAVGRFAQALHQIDLERGEPLETLDRLVALAWSELSRNEAIAHSASEHLSPRSLGRAHTALHAPLRAFIERGQKRGAFRDDLPADWLLSSYFALMHAYRDGISDGRLTDGAAVPTLQKTLGALFRP